MRIKEPCPEYREALMAFIATGEVSDSLIHINNCDKCRGFLEEVFQVTFTSLESFAETIREMKEKCVRCGKATPYWKSDHIDSRLYYVDGGSQLCKSCYDEIYEGIIDE